MNREALDAFFADAEDVLTDWDGSADSMNTGVREVTVTATLHRQEPCFVVPLLGPAFYGDADVDAKATSIMVRVDARTHAQTVDCPLCRAPVPDGPTTVQRRYGSAPDFASGYYRTVPSPYLYTLPCGHRIEVG